MSNQLKYLELVVKAHRDWENNRRTSESLDQKSLSESSSLEDRAFYAKWKEFIQPSLDASSLVYKNVREYYEQQFNTVFDCNKPFEGVPEMKKKISLL